jgi:thiol:disulfide interchange protein
LLPKPGPWMDTLKQITGFLIFATVIWLVSVAALQTAPTYLITILTSLFFMGVASWVLRHWSNSGPAKLVSLIFIISSLGLSFMANPAMKSAGASSTQSENGLKWEEYSPATLNKYRAQGNNVFVDFTAAWCISCKVNELVVFRSEDVKQKLQSHKVILLKADWTSHDEEITKALESLDRSGVPTYAIYEGNLQNKPILLPEVITPGIVISALDKLK